jgi:hypothetical protein
LFGWVSKAAQPLRDVAGIGPLLKHMRYLVRQEPVTSRGERRISRGREYDVATERVGVCFQREGGFSSPRIVMDADQTQVISKATLKSPARFGSQRGPRLTEHGIYEASARRPPASGLARRRLA